MDDSVGVIICDVVTATDFKRRVKVLEKVRSIVDITFKNHAAKMNRNLITI